MERLLPPDVTSGFTRTLLDSLVAEAALDGMLVDVVAGIQMMRGST